MTDNEIKAQVELIDPARAQDLLAGMTENRNLRPAKVTRYATDMRNGAWRLTGEAIKLDADGHVIDGEHRLRAVIKSGATIQTLVVYGVDLDDRVAMDTGANRTLSDHLRLRGESHYANLSSALVSLYSHLHGNYIRQAEPSHQELLRTLEQHPHIRDSVKATLRVAVRLRMPCGLIAALHYQMTALSADDCAHFWEHLYTGESLAAGDPILTLRNRMEENATTNRMAKRLHRTVVHAYIVKAWNAFREGRELYALRWNRGGAKPEPFPELV